jgi:SAM-dependent methyltransferase
MEVMEFLDKVMNEKLVDMILSGAKRAEYPAKIKVRPVVLKGGLYFQVTRYEGKKVLHENMQAAEAKSYIADAAVNAYKQTQVVTTTGQGSILSGKRNTATVKYKEGNTPVRVAAPLSHNRTKKYIINEGDCVEFMVDLGVMTKDGKIVRTKYDKFRQINRFLEFIEDVIPSLDKSRRQTIIDFGCGKSYLTFAMYYYLKICKGYDVHIIGLDLKEDVIAECSALAEKYGYTGLEFLVGDIASYDKTDHVDMVVTLHACDTATDYALYKAVRWGARVILSVPCCQHEANGQIENELLEPVLRYGIIRERMAALITDAVRADLLETQGYRTQILEFIDMEHTPKNLLIRAVKETEAAADHAALDRFLQELHLNLTLERLFKE